MGQIANEKVEDVIVAKIAEYLGRSIIFLILVVLALTPRFAFDVVAPWNPAHAVLWTIASVSLWGVAILLGVGAITLAFWGCD